VQDGVIIGKNTERIKVSTYLLTKRTFTDFRLTATVKLVQSELQEMQGGIAFWGQTAPDKARYTYAGPLVMFPSGWIMYDRFGDNGLLARAKDNGKQQDWKHVEILAQGNRVRVAVNGTQVVDWRALVPPFIKEGPIGLQLGGEPHEVRFKDLVLETFPEDKLTTVK
jgi:hypothetical protein